MLPPTHYKGPSSENVPDIQAYRDKIRQAEERRRYFEENPSAPGAQAYFAARAAWAAQVDAAFKPLLDHLADCHRLTAEDLAMRVG